MTKIKVNANKGGAVANKKIELEIVKGGIFPIELVEIANELKATVAVCHDDITEQMGIIISWG